MTSSATSTDSDTLVDAAALMRARAFRNRRLVAPNAAAAAVCSGLFIAGGMPPVAAVVSCSGAVAFAFGLFTWLSREMRSVVRASSSDRVRHLASEGIELTRVVRRKDRDLCAELGRLADQFCAVADWLRTAADGPSPYPLEERQALFDALAAQVTDLHERATSRTGTDVASILESGEQARMRLEARSDFDRRIP